MKHEPFFIIRWWRGLTLHMRLFLAFTSLFVFSVLALSLFLNNVIQMIRINRETQAIIEQNRQIYHLKTSVAQYQLALQSYENSVTERSFQMAEHALNTYSEQVKQGFSLLESQYEIDQDMIDQFNSSNAEIAGITTQVKEIIAAAFNEPDQVTEEQWNKVKDLDASANAAFEQVNQVVDVFQEMGQNDLAAINQEADRFAILNMITIVVVLPAFLLLAVLVALVIYQQINQPLDQLTEASQAVRQSNFQPQSLDHLTERSDEIGAIARLFIRMAGSLDQRSAVLRQEADAIREKIR